MQEFIQLKNNGLEKMNKEQFTKAIPDFDEVIAKAPIDTDEQVILKCVCLANRSMCYIAKNELEKAFNDANSIIDIYKEKRPETEADVANSDKLTTDPLIQVLALAYLRRGQIFECNGKLLDALQEYSISSALKITDESQKGIKHVLSTVGIPDLEQTDAELKPFGVILLHLLNEIELVAALAQLMTYLKEENLSQELVKKINETGAARVLIGAMQLYIEREPIVVGCLNSMRMCAEKGIQDVFNGFMVVRAVMNHWKENKNVIGDSLSLMMLAPPQLFQYMARGDFIPAVTAAFELEISEAEIDAAFFLLYSLSRTESQYTQIASEGILDIIFDKRTDASFMLLSKLLMLHDVCERSKEEHVIEWALQKLEQQEAIDEDKEKEEGKSDKDNTKDTKNDNAKDDTKEVNDSEVIKSTSLVTAALLTIANMLSYSDSLADDEMYQKMFPIIWKAIMANTKDKAIVSNGYATLALSAAHATKQVTELKAIRASSAILAIHTNEIIVAQNIVTFIFNCADNGLLKEVLEVKAALPTVMKVLTTFPHSQSIVERAVGLAVLCDHPNKVKLLEAGLLEFPNDEFLARFVSIIKDEKPQSSDK
ncbi:hypothetical protein M9Y10_023246 [Tritrichomonas musculus]|uniref:TPR Domain containing protein n=1 Tax=Tritrichomonas musculus TaxID=1915356 RepID=A0ABR2KUS4_9EUKA